MVLGLLFLLILGCARGMRGNWTTTPEEFKSLMVSHLRRIEKAGDKDDAASKSINNLSKDDVLLVYDNWPEVDVWAASVRNVEKLADDVIERRRRAAKNENPSGNRRFVWELEDPNYPPANSWPFQYQRCGGSAGLLQDGSYLLFGSEQTLITGYEDYYRLVMIADIGVRQMEILCTQAGCDPTGILCMGVCTLSSIMTGAFKMFQELLKMCQAHGENVDSAEIESGFRYGWKNYENLYLLSSDLDNFYGAWDAFHSSWNSFYNELWIGHQDSLLSQGEIIAASEVSIKTSLSNKFLEHETELYTHDSRLMGHADQLITHDLKLDSHDLNIQNRLNGHETMFNSRFATLLEVNDFQQSTLDNISANLTIHNLNIEKKLSSHNENIQNLLAAHEADSITRLNEFKTMVERSDTVIVELLVKVINDISEMNHTHLEALSNMESAFENKIKLLADVHAAEVDDLRNMIKDLEASTPSNVQSLNQSVSASGITFAITIGVVIFFALVVFVIILIVMYTCCKRRSTGKEGTTKTDDDQNEILRGGLKIDQINNSFIAGGKEYDLSNVQKLTQSNNVLKIQTTGGKMLKVELDQEKRGEVVNEMLSSLRVPLKK